MKKTRKNMSYIASLGSLDPFRHSSQHQGFFKKCLGSDAHETAIRHFDPF
ncbi:MAG: hypothetical protein ACPG9P_05770 [Candidatus Pseudothioglobus sp.]